MAEDHPDLIRRPVAGHDRGRRDRERIARGIRIEVEQQVACVAGAGGAEDDAVHARRNLLRLDDTKLARPRRGRLVEGQRERDGERSSECEPCRTMSYP